MCNKSAKTKKMLNESIADEKSADKEYRDLAASLKKDGRAGDARRVNAIRKQENKHYKTLKDIAKK